MKDSEREWKKGRIHWIHPKHLNIEPENDGLVQMIFRVFLGVYSQVNHINLPGYYGNGREQTYRKKTIRTYLGCGKKSSQDANRDVVNW